MAEIVAVSGLNGHAFGSFKQRGGSFMWLRDGLSKDLLSARVFIYGYDTHLHRSSSVQNLTDLGLGFRTALRNLVASRKGNKIVRPLLVIGHSLGGLVIKEAFLSMRTDLDKEILDQTNGFLFFGVPNLGMSIGSLVPMVGDKPNRALIETLGNNSALLRDHMDGFPSVFGFNKPEVVAFYETQLSRTTCKVEGKWKTEGPEALLVGFASATSGHSHYHPIDRNHSDIVKFDGRDDGYYRATLDYIRRLTSDTCFQLRHSTPVLSEDDQKCLDSLAFPNQDWHRDGVKSVQGTCNWIFSNEVFNKWLEDPQGLLWIRGKPGSGKSTIMKHILQSLEHRKSDEDILASFFFNGRGDNFLTTLLVFHRALLRQILPQCPEYLSQLSIMYQKGVMAIGDSWTWAEDELRRFFSEMIPKESTKRRVCILVDALDESGVDNAIELVGWLEKINESAQKVGGVLKICFTCRHYPIISYDNGSTINMEEGNYMDIRKVVKESLKKVKEDAGSIEQRIIRSAHGVFQWATLVVNIAVKLKIRRKNSQVILERIGQLPGDLRQLYRSLLFRSDPEDTPEDRRQTLKLFRWLCLSARPLTRQEIQHALAIDSETTITSVKQYMEGKGFTRDESEVDEVVKDLSRGLAEFQLRQGRYIFQPIH